MIVYITTFCSSLLLFLLFAGGSRTKLSNGENTSFKRLVISKFDLAVFIAALPPMIIAAIRYYVGTDYFGTYYSGFYRILDGSNVDGFEFGFWLLNKAIQTITDNVFWLFIFTSVLFVGGVYKAIGEISVDVPLSIILFFVTRYYFIGLNGIRQFIGLAFLLYSLKFVFENNLKKFLLIICLACMFHHTCVLFTPIFFISKIRLNIKKIFFLVICEFFLLIIDLPVVLELLNGTKYGLLIPKFNLAGVKFTLFTFVINLLLFSIGYIGRKQKEDIRFNTSVNIQFLALLSCLALQSIPLIERVYWIFSFPIIVTFPFLIKGLKNKGTRIATKWMVVIIFTIYMCYDICVLGDHDVLPYQTIFDKLPIHNSLWERYGGFVK